MGSLYTTIPGETIKGFAGEEYPVPMYLQFVPGYCVEVVHSSKSLRYEGEHTINTIIALPHIIGDLGKRKSTGGEEFRYYPLMRVHGDIPSKGDPVLLCTIGRVNYYLGPINMPNNSPTWNDDISYVPEPFFTHGGSSDNIGTVTERGLKGEGPNFNKEISYARLNKFRKKELDYGDAINETTGDYLIEGRHGNSIRVGSRSNKPYIFISNKRVPNNILESIADGSLISITSNGTLAQHLSGYIDVNTDKKVPEFKLSSDMNNETKYTIGKNYHYLNGQNNNDTPIYNYSGNQMLLHSDRIILDSKFDGEASGVFISSKKDIYIGASEYTTISSGKEVIIDTNTFNIGNPFEVGEDNMSSMVLGEELLEVLELILKTFGEILTPGGPAPAPLNTAVSKSLTQANSVVRKILSTKHKIEQG